MAVFADFNIEQSDNTKEFRFNETTGIYNASSNTGGYGTPNEATTDATAAVLEVTSPGGTLVSLDILTSDTFPKTDSTIFYTINSATLGGTADIALIDGAWLFTYKVTTATTTYTNTQTVHVSGSVRCCVYGMLCDADACDCDGSDLARALEAYTYYRMVVANALCGNTTKFTESLEIAQAYCDNCCSSC